MDSTDSNDSNASRIVATMSALAALSLAFMTLRLFCKKHYGKIFGWDDYILVCSWVIQSSHGNPFLCPLEFHNLPSRFD
jgi:hypothetical protein